MTIARLKETLNECRQQLQHPGDNYKKKIIDQYSRKVLDDISSILAHQPLTRVYEELTEYLKHNWQLVKGNFLSYTSIHDVPVTKFLIRVADAIADFTNKTKPQDQALRMPIEFLMPGIHLDSIFDTHPTLKAKQKTTMSREDQREMIVLKQKEGDFKKENYLNDHERRELIGLKQNRSLNRQEASRYEELLKKDMLEKDATRYSLLKLKNHNIYEENNSPIYKINGDWLCPKLSLSEILSTHIISDDGTHLIPVNLLLTHDILDPIIVSPYNEHARPLNSYEKERLITHSSDIQEAFDTTATLNSITGDIKSLYYQLLLLCENLRKYDAHEGMGTQEHADDRAYAAIINFSSFYKEKLSEEARRKIPENVRRSIEKLFEVATDSAKHDNATRNLETCIGNRREEIEKSLVGNEEILASIRVGDGDIEQLATEKKSQISYMREELRRRMVNGRYTGNDKLHIDESVCAQLSIRISIDNDHMIYSLRELSTSEFRQIFAKDPDELIKLCVRRDVNGRLVYDIDHLCTCWSLLPSRLVSVFNDVISKTLSISMANIAPGALNYIITQISKDTLQVLIPFLMRYEREARITRFNTGFDDEILKLLKDNKVAEVINFITALDSPDWQIDLLSSTTSIGQSAIKYILEKFDIAYARSLLEGLTSEALYVLIRQVRVNNQDLLSYVTNQYKDTDALKRMLQVLEPPHLLSLWKDYYSEDNILCLMNDKDVLKVIVNKLGTFASRALCLYDELGAPIIITIFNKYGLEYTRDLLMDLPVDALSIILSAEIRFGRGDTVLSVLTNNFSDKRLLKDFIIKLDDNASEVLCFVGSDRHSITAKILEKLSRDDTLELLEDLPSNTLSKLLSAHIKDGFVVHTPLLSQLTYQYKDEERLKTFIKALNSKDLLSLMVSMLPSDGFTSSFVIQELVDHPSIIKLILEQLNQDDRNTLFKHYSLTDLSSFLTCSARNPETLQIALSYLTDDEKLLVLKGEYIDFDTVPMPRPESNSIWHEASDNPESLKRLLEICPEDDVLRQIKRKDKYGQTLFQRIVRTSYTRMNQRIIITKHKALEGLKKRVENGEISVEAAKSFEDVISSDTEKELADIKHSIGEILGAVFKCYPEEQRLKVLKKRYEPFNIYIDFVLFHQEYIEPVLGLLSSSEVLKCILLKSESSRRSRIEIFLLGAASEVQHFEKFKKIVNMLDKEQCELMLFEPTQDGIFLVELLMSKYPERLEHIFKKFTPKECIHILKQNGSNNTRLLDRFQQSHQQVNLESLKVVLNCIPKEKFKKAKYLALLKDNFNPSDHREFINDFFKSWLEERAQTLIDSESVEEGSQRPRFFRRGRVGYSSMPRHKSDSISKMANWIGGEEDVSLTSQEIESLKGDNEAKKIIGKYTKIIGITTDELFQQASTAPDTNNTSSI